MPAGGTAAELFAGVGGFRLALEGHAASGLPSAGWRVTWSDQWEPQTRRQHASDCYAARFGAAGHHNVDVSALLDDLQAGDVDLPPVQLVVGGSPCQDYSVARALDQAAGLQGRKGVLWWQIHRYLKLGRPRYLLLENVDRLLRSPAHQRGRDFGVMLRCLSDLGYRIEWRIVNAADYGFPQRRRRLFIVCELVGFDAVLERGLDVITNHGILAAALPVDPGDAATHDQAHLPLGPSAVLPGDLEHLSDRFTYEFGNAGVAQGGRVWTTNVTARYEGRRRVLGDVLVDEREVPAEFFIPEMAVERWRYLKAAKREDRVARNGFRYVYREGGLPFPDRLDLPARTILTDEGGTSPSRTKHAVPASRGRLRRLTPIELERLNGFPDDWTATGMSAPRRAFCMGNALVVGVAQMIAAALMTRSASGDSSNLVTPGEISAVARSSPVFA